MPPYTRLSINVLIYLARYLLTIKEEIKMKTNDLLKNNVEENLAFSIENFCRLHGISRSKFYLLLNEGLAPKIMKIGRRTLISHEAAAQWRKDMERGNANL